MAIRFILPPFESISAAFVCFNRHRWIPSENKGLSITYQHQKPNLKAIRSPEMIFLWLWTLFYSPKRYYMCFPLSKFFPFGYFLAISLLTKKQKQQKKDSRHPKFFIKDWSGLRTRKEFLTCFCCCCFQLLRRAAPA